MASVTLSPTGASGWTNSGNVTASDDSRASTGASSRSDSATLTVSFPGAGLNPTDVIDSIQVDIEGYASAASSIRLSSPTAGVVFPGGVRRANTTYWATSDGIYSVTHGGSPVTSNYNSPWSLDIIVYNADTSFSRSAYIDYVSVTITYHAGTQEINPALLSVTPTLYGPSLTEILQPALLTTAPTLYSPALTEIVQPSLLTVSPTLYTPTLIQGDVILPPLLTVSPTLYSPALTETITPALLTVSPTFYTPTFNDVALPSLLTTTPTLYSPALTEIIQPALLTVTPVLYTPAVGDAIDVPLLTITPALYTPSLTEIIQPALLTVTPVLYTPRVAGPITYIHPLRIRLSGADILRTHAHSPATRARGNDAALRVRRTP